MLAIVVTLLLSAPTVSLDSEPTTILAGTWWVNGNGHYGELAIQVSQEGTIGGTIYGQPIAGTYDRAKRELKFKRFLDANDRAGKQEWTGMLTQTGDKRTPQFVLEGSFQGLSAEDPSWGHPGEHYSWKTQAVRLPSPAEDLKEMQGEWRVSGIVPCLNKATHLPEETGLSEKENAITIEGNELLLQGKVVATISNDLPSAGLQSEMGFKYGYRMLQLTLPDGQGLFCSFTFNHNDQFEIAYPHTTSCHRGSGQIIYLKRPTK